MLHACPPGFETAVIASNRDMGSVEPLSVATDCLVPYENSQVFYARPDSIRSLIRSFRFVRRWSPDAVYVNSFFDPRFSVLPQMLYLAGFFGRVIFAIAPRGEFDAGALQIKAQKKRAFIWLFKRFGLARRVVWHASTSEEARNIRLVFGPRADVIVRENDTNLPPSSSDCKPEKNDDVLRVVSLSRLAPKKGIDTLLEGLRGVTKAVAVDIIGPAEDKQYFERCRDLAAELPANVSVSFLGPVPHEDIRKVLATYDVMACPTKGENFGHVIAESLSVKCPVLCANVTPWTARLSAGGGVVVSENTPAGWAAAVNAYAGLTREEVIQRRITAGAAYNEWKGASKGPHFFSLLLQRSRVASDK
jgi:glycosyltransferase involved in cell wall biosynthesis